MTRPRRSARTGRRPGTQATQQEILAAARDTFADRGYDGATIRQIASRAGVDPALVHHYFGTKQQLFTAALQIPVDTHELVDRVVSGGVDGAGARLVRTFLTVWDSPAGAAGVALLRSAVTSPMAARLMREFVLTQILRRPLRGLGITAAEVPLRSALIASQMSGLAIVRYVLGIEPLASAPPETVVAAIGPTIQRYLTADLAEHADP